MKLTILDICFIIFATILISRIIWEVIPDCFKQYWNYGKMVRRDQKKGRKRKYTFSFKTDSQE